LIYLFNKNKAMKKFMFITCLTVLIIAAASAYSQEPQEKTRNVQKKENADHRNGAPDMRHKKPLPLPIPPVKAPDSTRQVVANPKKAPRG
jgi:hypothetical protein